VLAVAAPLPVYASTIDEVDEGYDISITNAEIQQALECGIEGMPPVDEPFASVFRSAPAEFYEGLSRDNLATLNLQAVEGDGFRLAAIQGNDRYQTAAAVTQQAYPEPEQSQWAIIAGGNGWPDALAATALAGVLDCPILLTGRDAIPEATVMELRRLGAENVIIVGGTAVVSEAAQTVLTDGGSRQVRRLAGADRYGTAESIYSYGLTLNVGGSRAWADSAIVASGISFADALSVAPVAFAQRLPIFLVPEGGMLTNDTQSLIQQDDNLRSFVIAGGIARVSEGANFRLTGIALSQGGGSPGATLRLSGEDRYETSVSIARWAVEKYGFTWEIIGLASGTRAPDALAASAMQGRDKSVMLLVGPTATAVTEALEEVLETGATIEQAHVFGGLTAISNRTRKALAITLGYQMEDIEGYKIYVYLDAGHGPNGTGNGLMDPGAIHNGYREYDLTTELVNKVASRLQANWPVLLHLNLDGGPYYLRDDEAVALGCDFIVSIHFNASTSSLIGTESYISYSEAHPNSIDLQRQLHPALIGALELKDCGLKRADFAIISNPVIPAVLLETCYISSTEDMEVYQSKKEQVADNLALAILNVQEQIDSWRW
jgi:N-acetylmuramoyl-L-alanine amidase